MGDRHANIDQHPASLVALLELSARHEKEGLGDAPWPSHYKKQPNEPACVQPSRRRTVAPSHSGVEVSTCSTCPNICGRRRKRSIRTKSQTAGALKSVPLGGEATTKTVALVQVNEPPL